MSDKEIKWLIERSHNAYLTHIGLWLTSMLGVITILTNIASNVVYLTLYKVLIFFMLYALLVGGMGFAVYRLTNILEEHIQWVMQLTDPLRTEILSHRGKLSKFFVTSDGKICIKNLYFIISAQSLVELLFFGLVNLAI